MQPQLKGNTKTHTHTQANMLKHASYNTISNKMLRSHDVIDIQPTITNGYAAVIVLGTHADLPVTSSKKMGLRNTVFNLKYLPEAV